jgi:hypothetical protein
MQINLYNPKTEFSGSYSFTGKCRSKFVNLYCELPQNTGFPRDYYVKTKEAKVLKPHYFISFLWGDGSREGTNFVQDVVIKSLKDSRSKGRVILDAKKIDARTSPAGFYYKLGFRFVENKLNNILDKWLKYGGTKFNTPDIEGKMYLPKENIENCIRY